MAQRVAVGVLLNAFFGLRRADSLAVLVLVYFIVHGGHKVLHEA